MRRVAHLLRGVAALAATIAVVAGVPAALVEFVGWPLPTRWPTLDQLQRAASMGITEATVIKTLAVVVWLAWSQVAIAIVAECVALVRRRPVRGWVLLPGAQGLASKLVAGVLLITTTVGPRTHVEARPLESVIGQVEAPQVTPTPDPSEAPEAAATEAAPSTTAVTVGERGSWWQLADDHLGDGLRWREIRDLNVGREAAAGVVITEGTEQLEAGWSLLVPDAEGRAPASVAPPVAESAHHDSEHVVESGEHFWEIAEDTLAEGWDRTPTDQETASYWRELIEDNRDRLAPPGDPDLIHPGQVFVLPDIPGAGQDVDVAKPSVADPAINEKVNSSLDAEPPAPSVDPRNETASPPHSEHAVKSQGGWASSITDSEAAPATPSEEDARTAWGTPLGLTGGVAATALLGAGLLGVLRRRRRAAVQRHIAGLRIPTPPPEAQRTEARLAAAAPTAERLTDLAALLASIPSGVAPVLVTTSDDGMVTLLFAEDDDLPAPPDPWELAHDGEVGPVGWQARIGSRGTVRSIGLPLLVTLGRTGPTTVLVNVGAMQTLTVRGEDADVLTCLRRFALEAAVSPVSGPLEVVVDDERLLAGVPSIRMSDDLKSEVVAAVAEQTGAVVEEDRTVQLLVAVVGTPAIPADLHTVLGLVTSAATTNAAWVIDVAGGELRLHLPDGAVLDLNAPEVDLDHVDESLDVTGRAGADWIATEASDHAEGLSNAEEDPLDRPVGRARPWCEVQVLGQVRVLLDGEELQLARQQRELVAYLACHRGAEAEQVEDAIWAGQVDPTGQRLRTALTRLRSTLGDGPDGEPLVQRRTGPGQGIRLSNHVSTDLDRALEAVSGAWSLEGEERLSALRSALEAVRGAPFENLPATWTTALTHTAIVRLQEAALKLSRTLRNSGELDRAEQAVRRGLLLCDPSEPLYREWAEIEAARGRPDRIRALGSRLRDLLAEDTAEADAVLPTPIELPRHMSALG